MEGTTKTLFRRISFKHTIPPGKTVRNRSLIMQARYQTSIHNRVSGVDCRSAADVDAVRARAGAGEYLFGSFRTYRVAGRL